MVSQKPLVSVVIPSYNSRRHIKQCLDSVLNQTYPNVEVLVVVNGNDDQSAEYMEKLYRRFKRLHLLYPGENLWFSRGNNYGINRAQGEYILTLNDDTMLEPDYIARLVREMEIDLSIGSATGKLMHYKYDINSKTRILDSTGIEMFRTRRVIDRGQWEQDRGQYDDDQDVFGASGAAAMFRRSALEEAKLSKADGLGFEYFDEDFVAYKEDIDLAWRLRILGWNCKYFPEAVLYHGRSVGRAWPTQFIRFILNRRRQSRLVRRLSFKNHYLMMVKNEIMPVFWRHCAFIFFRELLLLGYTLFFEPFQFLALRDFFRQLPEAKRKRELIMAKARVDLTKYRKIFH